MRLPRGSGGSGRVQPRLQPGPSSRLESCSVHTETCECGVCRKKDPERTTGKEATGIVSTRPTWLGPASAGPTAVHAGQLSSSLPRAQSTALLCMGVASAVGPGTSLQPPPGPRLGSDLGGLAPAVAHSPAAGLTAAPAAPPSPGPVGVASPVWPCLPGSPRWLGRGSSESLPAVAQGLVHGVRARAKGRLHPVKGWEPGSLLREDPRAQTDGRRAAGPAVRRTGGALRG